MHIAAKKIIGLKVETKGGQKLGRVRDFDINTELLEIKKFYVRPAGIVKGLTDGDLIIAKSQILAIDEKKMTVLDLAAGELAKNQADRETAIESVSLPISASSTEE